MKRRIPTRTPISDYRAFSGHLTAAFHDLAYWSRAYPTDRSLLWATDTWSSYLHVVPVSAHSYQVARLAVAHYRVPASRFRDLPVSDGGLKPFELSIHREELVSEATAQWFAGYTDSIHRGTTPETPPFAVSDEHSQVGSSYWWSKEGNRQSILETLSWPRNRDMREEAIRGQKVFPDFEAGELQAILSGDGMAVEK